MTTHQTEPKVTHISCDATGCEAKLTIDPPVGQWDTNRQGQRIVEKAMVDAGWSRWVSRGSKEYCPAHGPRPGGKSRQVIPRPESWR